MSVDKQSKGNWHLALIGVILVSIITIEFLGITPLDFNQAKNSVINIVKNINWGFGETKVITITTEKDKKGIIIKTTESEHPQSKKTFWNWLELLAVPIVLTTFTFLYQRRDKAKELEQAELERKIAKDNQAEEAIQAYLDNMAKLLLNKKLKKELFSNVELKLILNEKLRKELSINDKLNFLDKDNPVKNVARIQTITILRRLEGDEERQTRIIDFLRDAKLYKFIFKNANLSGINLSQVILEKANLQGANLYNADLQGVSLSKANLQGANLQNINLQGANLYKANLQEAQLFRANLKSTFLKYANLQNARLRQANLQDASLKSANLQYASLTSANLQYAMLGGAKLQNATLGGANFLKADFRGANLTVQQIKSSCFWKKAIYKSGRIFFFPQSEKKLGWLNRSNQKYIRELSKDKSSDSEERPNRCSKWK